MSQNPTEQIFGLGHDTVDELRVQWPDGSETVISDIEANHRLVVRQPDPWAASATPPRRSTDAIGGDVPGVREAAHSEAIVTDRVVSREGLGDSSNGAPTGNPAPIAGPAH